MAEPAIPAGQAQLEAVHALLSHDRIARESDLFITTALAELRSGVKTEDYLLESCRRTWPGARIGHGQMSIALTAASGAGYVRRVEGDEPAWALTVAGHAEAASAHEWASRELADMASEVQARVEPTYRPLSDDEARIWVLLLAQAISEGIRHSVDLLQGEVDFVPGDYVLPRTFDSDRMIGFVEGQNLNSAAHETLVALVFDAIDRASAFGNALVSHVTVGYVLQAFVARRDYVSARQLVGSLDGTSVALDTMILLRLLGPPEHSRPLWDLIRASLDQGMQIEAFAHSIDELDELLAANGESATEVEAALRDGVDITSLISFASGEPIRYWLMGRLAGTYTNWRSFLQAAGALSGRLTQAGVAAGVVYSGPQDVCARARAALAAELAVGTQRAEAVRRPRAIDRDAITIAAVAVKRQTHGPSNSMWPRGWIASTDRHLTPAYFELVPTDKNELAVAPSQWVGLISTFAAPAELPDLAASASSLLMDETTLSLTGTVPISEAISVARMLQPDAQIAPLELRLERLTIAGALKQAYGEGVDSSDLPAEIAARVSARRALRGRSQRQQIVASHAKAEQVIRTELSTAQAELASERATAKARDLAAKNEWTSAVEIARTEERLLARRRLIVIVTTVLCTLGGPLAIGAAALLGLRVSQGVAAGILLFGVLAAVWTWRRSRDYVRSTEASYRDVVSGVAVEVVALALTIVVSHFLL